MRKYDKKGFHYFLLPFTHCTWSYFHKNGMVSCSNFDWYFTGKEPKGVNTLLPTHVTSEAKDLLILLLQYDPDARPSSHRALQHAYFKDLRYDLFLMTKCSVQRTETFLKCNYKNVENKHRELQERKHLLRMVPLSQLSVMKGTRKWQRMTMQTRSIWPLWVMLNSKCERSM